MHVIDIFWQNQEIKTLAPIWATNLDVLFVGLNPSPPSLEAGHYHQGKLGKRFWDRLRSIGVLEGAEAGREDEVLLKKNFGITDIVPRSTARAEEVSEEEYQLGGQFVIHQIQTGTPRIVCFIYKKALEVLLGGQIPAEGGLIESDDEIWTSLFGNSRVFLFPSPYAPEDKAKKTLEDFKKLLEEVRASEC